MIVDKELLEEVAEEMYIILKQILETEKEDYIWCATDYRKETNGCPHCRACYAGHELIEYIEAESANS